MSRTLTVGQLIRRLQDFDPHRPALLAVNPDWPFAHAIGEIVEGEGDGGPALYIAEDGQRGYLPVSASDALGWHEVTCTSASTPPPTATATESPGASTDKTPRTSSPS